MKRINVFVRCYRCYTAELYDIHGILTFPEENNLKIIDRKVSEYKCSHCWDTDMDHL